ncbi:MAG: GTPase ObgE [Acidobacteria bacterium]|nr:GTPase ObgE [Acidobacteriota bacterium]MSO60521.1 GTPase ObgE [Acidobacteriota bacterium]
MFVDEVDIHIKAGDGGSGSLSFRREKFVPKGGPDGGNGGAGGSVFLVADPHRNTLVHFRFNPDYKAQRGGNGAGALRTGRGGRDMEIPVPVGTLVFKIDPETGEKQQAADLTIVGQRVLLAQGGRGGLGNAHFATATNRAPRKVQPGEPGQQFDLHLKLKLLADVGLVGYPNAGKSTLISVISAAKPKIAAYPFTTLTPNLGVVALSGDRDFVVADVPGLIEGAHEGHGLGHQFLRHIERTKVIIHMVDVSGASGRDPVEDLDTIRQELELYNPELLAKPHLVAANKIDAVDDPKRVTALEKRAKKLKLKFFQISAVAGTGVKELIEAAWPIIAKARELEAKALALGEDATGDLSAGLSTVALAKVEALAEAEVPADYNPALMPPLRSGTPKKR